MGNKVRNCKWAECKAAFTPMRRNQVHCCPEHRNRAAQKKYRQRVQKALKMAAQEVGA